QGSRLSRNRKNRKAGERKSNVAAERASKDSGRRDPNANPDGATTKRGTVTRRAPRLGAKRKSAALIRSPPAPIDISASTSPAIPPASKGMARKARNEFQRERRRSTKFVESWRINLLDSALFVYMKAFSTFHDEAVTCSFRPRSARE